MTLFGLREIAKLAQKYRDDDAYHYDFAEHVSPELILSLLNERDILLGALSTIKERTHPKSDARILATNALASSNELFPDDEIGV